VRVAARLLACVALAAWVNLPAEATILVTFGPPGQPLSALIYDELTGGPCVNWSFLGREGSTLWVLGTSTECPGTEDVNLPSLAPGRYRLVASLENGDVWDEIWFVVLGDELITPIIAVSPSTPGPADPVAISVSSVQSFFGGTELFFTGPPTVEGDRIVFDVEVSYCPFTCPPPTPNGYTGHRFLLPPLTPGLKTVVIQFGPQVIAERSFTVADPAESLSLNEGRFEVRLDWRDHPGEGHAAAAVPLTDLSGSFWFFHPENIEMVVKVLDGRGVNGAFWLFAASMTDLGYTLTVIDHDLASCESTGPCPRTRTYEGAPGTNHNVIDTNLFSP